jgi:hypothetical protein
MLRTVSLTLCFLICGELSALSKGSSVIKDDPRNPEHINVLPAEIRQYIAGICKGPPAADHDFATYLPGEKRWRINIEYLHCDGLGEYRQGTNVSTWISSPLARIFDWPESTTPLAAFERKLDVCRKPNSTLRRSRRCLTPERG